MLCDPSGRGDLSVFAMVCERPPFSGLYVVGSISNTFMAGVAALRAAAACVQTGVLPSSTSASSEQAASDSIDRWLDLAHARVENVNWVV